MSVTVYDIAREAKVGIGTVSRVFNNHPNVTASTREKVISVAKRLNYHPHAYAQALARKKSNTLAALIPFFTNYFFIEVLKGVQDKAASLGYDMILYGINHPHEIDEYLRKSMIKGRVDGILFASMQLPTTFAERFKEQGKPVVLIDAYYEYFDSLVVENVKGAITATNHLISLGHKKIGMINGNLVSVPARERLQGFKEAMNTAGLFVPDSVINNSNLTKLDGFSREAGFVAMREMLNLGDELPTAIVISSDIQAIGAISALRQRGLRIPDDVALVSFDDIEMARDFSLTTMRQPMYEMGEIAVETLVARIAEPASPITTKNYVPRLIVRGTCGMNKRYTPIEDVVVAKN